MFRYSHFCSQFMLKMYKEYNRAAEDGHVLVVTACGYGSVPATMGLVYLEKEFSGMYVGTCTNKC